MTWTLLEPVRVRWWNSPLAVLRAVHRRRTNIPAPWIYFAAAALGSLTGVVLDVWLDLPWWLFGLAAVGAAWFVFLLSAVLPGGGTRDLWTDVLREVAPSKGHAREERRFLEVLREPPFPIYGLSERWVGRRFVGGHGSGTREGINDIELAHGNDPFDEAEPQIRVRAERREFDLPLDLKLEQVARSLWGHMHRPPMSISSQDEFDVWAREDERAFERRGPVEPRIVQIPVEGMPIPFQYFSEGPFWGAVASFSGVIVTVDARNIDVREIELVRVTDPEPYIEGSRLLFDTPF